MDLNAFTYMAYVHFEASNTPMFRGLSHIQALRLLGNALKAYGFEEEPLLPTEAGSYKEWSRSDGLSVVCIANKADDYDANVTPMQRLKARIDATQSWSSDIETNRRSLRYMAESCGLDWRGDGGRDVRRLIQENALEKAR